MLRTTAVPLRAVLIDDDPTRRDGLRTMATSAGLDVAAAAGQGVGLGEALAERTLSVVFVSMEEPFVRTLQTIGLVHERLPDVAIIAYSTTTSVVAFQQAIRAGARHLLRAPLNDDEVFMAIMKVTGQWPARRARHAGARGDVISVVGQKGGIGKTTIAINLAATLAREVKSSVLLIDFDTLFGDVALHLDVSSEYTTAAAATEMSGLDFQSFKSTLTGHESGAYVLGAPRRAEDWIAVRAEDLEGLVSFATGMFDYVIVDTPGAHDEAIAAGLAVADHALIVTSLELASARNTALLLDTLREEGFPEERAVVIANHITSVGELEPVDLAPVLDRDSMWVIPHDPAVRRATQIGKPVSATHPKSPASLSLRALAHRIAVDPDRVDRRQAVRGKRRPAGAALRLRLTSALARARGTEVHPADDALVEPEFRFRRTGDSGVYHAAGCPAGRRILPVNRSSVPLRLIPGQLRPCRVCRPPVAA